MNVNELGIYNVKIKVGYIELFLFENCGVKLKVCKSVHHHTIQINHQPDATISPVYYLTFIYSSTCFERSCAHYQELNNCSSSLWFYRWNVLVGVLLVVVGPAGPTTTNITAITTLQR
jgi:hypothetical protein